MYYLNFPPLLLLVYCPILQSKAWGINETSPFILVPSQSYQLIYHCYSHSQQGHSFSYPSIFQIPFKASILLKGPIQLPHIIFPFLSTRNWIEERTPLLTLIDQDILPWCRTWHLTFLYIDFSKFRKCCS